MSTEEYFVERAYVGMHFAESSQLSFKGIALSYPHLRSWATGSEWLQKSNIPRARFTEPEFTVVRPEPARLAAVTAGGTLELWSEVRWRGDFVDEVHLRRELWFSIAWHTDLSFEEWRTRVIQPLTNFLSLATATLTRPTRVSVSVEVPAGKAGPRLVEVWSAFSKIDLSRSARARLPGLSAMPLALRDFEGIFEQVLGRWMDVYQQLPTLLDLFFSVHNGTEGYLEHQFLSLVQVAESYHRLRVKRNELDPDQHGARVKEILATCPDSHRSWLEDQLRFSNELRLRRRLRELFMSSRLTERIAPDWKDVTQWTVETRNGIVHGDKDVRPSGEGRFGLFRLMAILSLVIQECLLRELGVGEGQAAASLERTWEYAYAVRVSEAPA
jgi:hypothetical protein